MWASFDARTTHTETHDIVRLAPEEPSARRQAAESFGVTMVRMNPSVPGRNSRVLAVGVEFESQARPNARSSLPSDFETQYVA
jgi:hypothetical protein